MLKKTEILEAKPIDILIDSNLKLMYRQKEPLIDLERCKRLVENRTTSHYTHQEHGHQFLNVSSLEIKVTSKLWAGSPINSRFTSHPCILLGGNLI